MRYCTLLASRLAQGRLLLVLQDLRARDILKALLLDEASHTGLGPDTSHGEAPPTRDGRDFVIPSMWADEQNRLTKPGTTTVASEDLQSRSRSELE